MISKKTVRKLASVFIVGLLAAIFTVNSFAIEYGGTSGEGGQSTSSGGGRYSIEENNGVCGYRFTMVYPNGAVVNDTKSVDVLCSGYKFYDKASRAWRFSKKHPKTWWIGNVSSKFDWTQNNDDVVVDDKYGLSLPTDTKKNEEMMKNEDNLTKVLGIIGFSGGVNDIPGGGKVLCEPLFLFSAQGHLTTMTITEIGVYGRYFFGEDKGTISSYDKNSWEHIANFTNLNWPRQLYSEDTMLGWTGATYLDKKTSFKNLIYYGYGVSFAYDPKTPPAVTPTPDTKVPVKLDTYLRLYYDPGYTQRVAEGDILREGETYYPIYTFVSDAPEVLNYYISCGCIQNQPIVEGVYPFSGSYEIRGSGVVLDANLPYIDSKYTFGESFLGFYSSFGLYGNQTQSGTGAKYVRKPGSTDTVSVDWHFTIIQPSAEPILYDRTGVEALVNSVNDKKLYSGQALNGNVLFTNNSSFSARFRYGTGYSYDYLKDIDTNGQGGWYLENGTYQFWYVGTEDNYVAPGGRWTTAGLNFRPDTKSIVYDFNAVGCIGEATYWQATGSEAYVTTKTVPYTIYPTDLAASNIQFIDADTGTALSKVNAGQKVIIRYTFTNNTGVPVCVSYHGGHDHSAANVNGVIFGSDEVVEKTAVMLAWPNQIVVVDTAPFLVDGDYHSQISADSGIYLFDLRGNTDYETNGENNTCSYSVRIERPITVRPGKADGSTAIELFYDKDRTQRVPDGELLREGVTYYPRLWFYSDAEDELRYLLKYHNYTYPYYNSYYTEFDKPFTGEFWWDVDAPFTVGPEYEGAPYRYEDANIITASAIDLKPDQSYGGGYYVDNDPNNNYVERENKFTIIQPSAQPILYDLTGVDALVNSMNNKKLYSGQALNGNVLFTNNSSFSARFRYGTGYTEQYLREISAQNQEYWYSYDNTYQHWYNGTEENYVAPGGIWTTAGINFRAYADSLKVKGFIATGCVQECSCWEATKNKAYETVKNVEYTVYPTDLAASNIQFIDADTGEVLNKVRSGQRIFVRYVFANNTGVPVLAAYHGGHDNTVAVFAAYTFGSNEVKKDTLVIPANGRIYIETSPFLADGKNHSVIKAESNIYLFDKVGNTYFETNHTNNVKKNDAVGQPGVVPITSPYKVTLVAPNSTYRRGTTVVTSFEIQNLSDVLINGPKQKRAKSNAVAMLELYTGPNRTGKRLGEIDGSFTVPAGETTLVWFQWEVPEDAPDVIYGYITADRSMEYIGSQNASQEVSFAIGSNRNVNTPDTAYADREAYWWHWEQLPYSLMNQAVEDHGIQEYQTWGYWTIDGDRVVYKIDCAGLSGSTATVTPIRNVSSHYDKEWDRWVMRSGYGFDLTVHTGRPDSRGCTDAQTVYSYFPEFIYSNASLDSKDRFGRYADEYFNNNGKRVGFNSIYDVEGNLLHPESGGDYATFVTMKDLGGGHFILPRSDLVDENVHFIPVWYPDGSYQVLCYVRDYWTPGGMISGFVESNTVKIDGCMYDDIRISFSPADPCDHRHQTTKNTDANKPGRAHYTGDVYCEDCKRKLSCGRVIR